MANLVDARQMYVVKSNTMIQRSRFSLSLVQQKIILYLISRIQPNDTEFIEYEFSIPDFCRCIGIEAQSGTNYKDIKTAIKSIRDKSMWIDLGNGTSSLVSWIEKARIIEGQGTIQIRLDNDLKPWLLELKEHYTQYQLIFTLRMRSRYSIRLYETIKSYYIYKSGLYKKYFTVEELRKLLDAEKYVRFCDLHSDVIKKAVSEINKYTDLDLTYIQIKKGKKTIGIEFSINTKNPLDRLRVVEETDLELGTNQLKLF